MVGNSDWQNIINGRQNAAVIPQVRCLLFAAASLLHSVVDQVPPNKRESDGRQTSVSRVIVPVDVLVVHA